MIKKWTKISVIFLLSLFVFNYLGLIVHEAGGHALAAKLLGAKVKKIKIASRWNLLRFKTGKTVWEFNSLPLRGQVIHGGTLSWIKDLIVTFVGYPLEMLFFYLIYKLIKKKEENISPNYFIFEKSVFRWAIIFLMIITTIWNFPFLRSNDFTHIAEVLIYGKRTHSLHLLPF